MSFLSHPDRRTGASHRRPIGPSGPAGGIGHPGADHQAAAKQLPLVPGAVYGPQRDRGVEGLCRSRRAYRVQGGKERCWRAPPAALAYATIDVQFLTM
jgi:hypothetical protein